MLLIITPHTNFNKIDVSLIQLLKSGGYELRIYPLTNSITELLKIVFQEGEAALRLTLSIIEKFSIELVGGWIRIYEILIRPLVQIRYFLEKSNK